VLFFVRFFLVTNGFEILLNIKKKILMILTKKKAKKTSLTINFGDQISSASFEIRFYK
jgi:hypothetical protein